MIQYNPQQYSLNDIKNIFTMNVDLTLLNLKESLAKFKVLMDSAKTSWLL
jgi:hypothetical protein